MAKQEPAPKLNLTYNELVAQVATGVISSPHQIATLVAVSGDPQVVTWAYTHKAAVVRQAAVEHESYLFGNVVKASFFDRADSVRKAAQKVLEETRRPELELFFELLEDYPQLSFPFAKDRIDIDAMTKKRKTPEIDEHLVEELGLDA